MLAIKSSNKWSPSETGQPGIAVPPGATILFQHTGCPVSNSYLVDPISKCWWWLVFNDSTQGSLLEILQHGTGMTSIKDGDRQHSSDLAQSPFSGNT